MGLFFTPPLFLATKVTISFVCYSPKTIKCTQKTKIEKMFRGIDLSSECHSPHHIYNSLLRMRAIQELKVILYLYNLIHLQWILVYKHSYKNPHCWYNQRFRHKDVTLLNTHRYLIWEKKGERKVVWWNIFSTIRVYAYNLNATSRSEREQITA